VHERTLNEKIAESDRRMIEFTVNNKLIPLLANWGVSLKEGERFVFDRSEELSLKEHWEVIAGAMQYYEMDEVILKKDFKLPIIGKKEQSQPTSSSGGISANFQ
jgi:hypothetical protein